MQATREIISALAPTGTLRAAINLSNFLLVTGRAENGDPTGVAPSLAGEIAARLGVPLQLLPFARPGELADAVATGSWDIGLIGADPARAEKIAFTPAYVEIESTFLVPAGSTLQTIADVDRPGVCICSVARAAYDLWLDRHIAHATLTKAQTIDDSFTRFVDEKLDALAGLRPRLLADVEKLPGARILDGYFATVQQAVGVPSDNQAGACFLSAFVAEAKRSGLIARLIETHAVRGLSVARDPEHTHDPKRDE